MTVDPLSVSWRVGRKVGRTIYAQHGPEPAYASVQLGGAVMGVSADRLLACDRAVGLSLLVVRR